MKEGAYMTISGPDIAGSCNYEGHEDTIEVLHFNHWVARPLDPADISRTSGEREFGLVSIKKDVDKSTPLLVKACCEGQTIEKIEIKWYRQPEEGSTEAQHYATNIFEKCLIAGVRPSMAGGTGGGAGHAWEEIIDFGFRQATWRIEDGGIEFQDSVRS